MLASCACIEKLCWKNFKSFRNFLQRTYFRFREVYTRERFPSKTVNDAGSPGLLRYSLRDHSLPFFNVHFSDLFLKGKEMATEDTLEAIYNRGDDN